MNYQSIKVELLEVTEAGSPGWSSLSYFYMCCEKWNFWSKWLIELTQFWLGEPCFSLAPSCSGKECQAVSPAEDTVFLLLALWGFVLPKTHGNKSRYDFVLGILYGHHDWHCNYRFLHCLCFSKGTSQCSEAVAEKICARFYYSI